MLKNIITLFLALWSITAFALIVAITIDRRNHEDYLIRTSNRLSEAVMRKQAVSKGEEALTYKSFWMQVIQTHSDRYAGRRLSEDQAVRVIEIWWRAKEIFDFPPNYLPACGLGESNLNPKCKGPFDEEGMYQLHATGVEHARLCNLAMEKYWPSAAREFGFDLRHHEDVRNPLVAAKVQIALAWWSRRRMHPPLYWISDVHWGGLGRVDKWYIERKEPPFEYVFYSSTNVDKIDRRHPLGYYYRVKAIMDKLDAWDVNVYKELKDYKDFKYQCEREEREYVEARKFLSQILSSVEEYRQKEKSLNADLEKIEKQLDEADDKCRKIYGEGIKKDENYKEIFSKTKKLIKSTMKKIRAD